MGTFTNLNYQVVFGGKDHIKFLNEEYQDELFAYFGGILKNMGCKPHIVGGHEDHVHLVFSASGKYSIGRIVQDLKTSSNSFIKKKPYLCQDFSSWQVGYGAFSYRISEVEKLIGYVKRQKEHHNNISFEEEYIALLAEHGIEFEHRFLFT